MLETIITEYPQNDIYFEPVTKYKNAGLALPVRKTAASAGYDFVCAEDVVIYPYMNYYNLLQNRYMDTDSTHRNNSPKTLEEVAAITKECHARPTLVATGMKCHMPKDCYLELSVRSSTPLKHWLILANGVGIIDSDYYDCDGHIQFQLINLSPFPIALHKGDIIGQGIIKPYLTTSYDVTTTTRTGGFGSTSG